MAEIDKNKLILLYVSKIDFETPSLPKLLDRSPAGAYVEVSRQDAQLLINYLTERLEKETSGAISFQLHGTLVI